MAAGIKRMDTPVFLMAAGLARRGAESILGFLIVLIVILSAPARAHEMQPAVADVAISDTAVELTIILQGEAMVAGIDLSSITDTNNSPRADAYDALRALDPPEFADRFLEAWPELSDGFRLSSGETLLDPVLRSVETEPAMSDDLPRQTRVTLGADLPPGDAPVTIGWREDFGPMILRQIVEDLPEGEEAYAAFLGAGQTSAPLPRTGTVQLTGIENFVNYIGLGFTHIIPKGIDHILFVLGLFLFSTHIRPIFFQITAFTLAHTLTLALASLGLVSVPSAIVEPLIALSIAYVAIENIVHPKLSRSRLLVVFGFGLLHGLGFASVLGEIGLSPAHFLSSLIAFNIGVELGQIAIIAGAFFAVAVWFAHKPWYRARVQIPASALIGLAGLWWAFERVILA